MAWVHQLSLIAKNLTQNKRLRKGTYEEKQMIAGSSDEERPSERPGTRQREKVTRESSPWSDVPRLTPAVLSARWS